MQSQLLQSFLNNGATLTPRTLPQQPWAAGYSYGDFIDGFAQHIHHTILETYQVDRQDTAKERLFEIMMMHFDELQTHRALTLSILRNLRTYPLFFLPRRADINATFSQLLRLAQVPTRNPLRYALWHKGIKLTFLKALKTWHQDESDDLSATMKALDQGLSRLEQLQRPRLFQKGNATHDNQ